MEEDRIISPYTGYLYLFNIDFQHYYEKGIKKQEKVF